MNVLQISFVIFICVIVYKQYINKIPKGMTTIEHKGRSYNVNSSSSTHMKKVASILFELEIKKEKLFRYIEEDTKLCEQKRFKKLLKNKNFKLEEIQPEYFGEAAYSINKGEVIGMCVYNNNKFIYDDNTMFFVFMHELSHIMSEKYAHDEEFWTNFGDLIDIAKKHNLYDYENYKKTKTDFCGHTLTDNPNEL